MLVVVAAAMVGLMGLAAISLDVGQLFTVRQELKNVADAAALAAAQVLPEDPWGARQAALDMASLNGVPADRVSVTLTMNEPLAAVGVRGTANFTFARVLGTVRQELNITSAARSGVVSSLQGVVPLGVEQDDFISGQSYQLKLTPRDAGVSELGGNFWALTIGSQGASTYERNLKFGAAEKVSVGDLLATEPGNMVGPTDAGINFRIDLDADSSSDRVKAGSPRVLLVPIVEFQGAGRTKVRVSGFGAFFLEENVRPGEIRGRFIRLTTEGLDFSAQIPDYGLRVVKLVQ